MQYEKLSLCVRNIRPPSPKHHHQNTQEQLGYSVSCGLRMTNGVLGLAVRVQSERYEPEHLHARVEAFLRKFADRLRRMPEKEFYRCVRACGRACVKGGGCGVVGGGESGSGGGTLTPFLLVLPQAPGLPRAEQAPAGRVAQRRGRAVLGRDCRPPLPV